MSNDTNAVVSPEANVSVATVATEYFFLVGDIGGTNSRLALYRHKEEKKKRFDVNDSNAVSDSEVDNRHLLGMYHRPLFTQDYRNEEVLANDEETDTCDTHCSAVSSSSSGGGSDSSRANKNVTKFVEKIIGPFLEECWEAMVASLSASTNVSANDAIHKSPSNIDKIKSKNLNNEKNHMMEISIVCCLAIAGPVDTNLNSGTVLTSQRDSFLTGLNGMGILKELMHHPRCRKTSKLRPTFKACVIINDFMAQGYGCCLSLSTTSISTESESSSSVVELKQIDSNSSVTRLASKSGPKLCVGAGTGFGSCYLVPMSTTSSNIYSCLPSEFGQTEWVPNTANIADQREGKNGDDDQVELWKYLLNQKLQRGETARLSVEDVVSGVGLANAYSCFSNLYPHKVNPAVQEQFNSSSDLRGKIVGANANNCEICKRAMDAVIIAYGTVVGSCAMTFLPSGGVYITGGLLVNLLETNDPSWKMRSANNLEDDENGSLSPTSPILSLFLKSYRSKGRASFLLDSVPLYIVLAKDAGLRGAAVHAEMVLQTLPFNSLR